jgi:hypothetical protein
MQGKRYQCFKNSTAPFFKGAVKVTNNVNKPNLLILPDLANVHDNI